MLTSEALTVANKIFQAVFGQDNPYTLTELKDKFAFDIDHERFSHSPFDDDSKTLICEYGGGYSPKSHPADLARKE